MKAVITKSNTAGLFFQGMATIGQLFPSLPEEPEETPLESAWRGVGDAFAETGDTMRFAIKEFKNAQRLEQNPQAGY
ncbi:hypothetical protein FACS1894147_13040 [Spirochaetia bacterium]|nr:hypothetical protein FACS1894147_13040 [Spirochaetia bacterium]